MRNTVASFQRYSYVLTSRRSLLSRNIINCLKRRSYHELSYAMNGEPIDVLTYQKDASITDNDHPPMQIQTKTTTTTTNDASNNIMVKVEMLHVPWNPADVNTVQGKYPYPAATMSIIPSKPNIKSRYFENYSVSGSEGWGRIVATTSNNNDSNIHKMGSLVTMGIPGIGTLRSSLWVPESYVLQVPEEVALLNKLGTGGCTLFQLGGTAWRMLNDFVPPVGGSTSTTYGNSGLQLEPGDVVLQNAGNSGVGLMTSQLATAKLGLSVVSLVRRGSKTEEEFQELVNYLKTVGKNALVVAEEDLQESNSSSGGDPKTAMKSFLSQLKELSGSGTLPKLALNAIGGDSAKLLMKALEPGGTMVTYGGMSMKPVSIATPQLIFKDIRVVGYWHSRWMVTHDSVEKQLMINELVSAVLDHDVQCPPVGVFPLHEVKQALDWQSNQKGIRSKLVWDCQEHNSN